MPAGLLMAGASVAGAAISASATNKAAKASKQAADASLAARTKVYQDDVGRLTPWITAGGAARDSLNGLLGLSGDPDAYNQAFNKYLASTNYKFKLDQGLSAVTNQRASRGLVNSGGTAKALSQYATNLAQSATDGYFGQLQAVSALGHNAAASLGGAGQSYANAVAGINSDRAQAAGEAARAQAGNINGLLSAGLGALSSIGRSSYGPKLQTKENPVGSFPDYDPRDV